MQPVEYVTLREFITETRSYVWTWSALGPLRLLATPLYQTIAFGVGISALIASIVEKISPHWSFFSALFASLPLGLLCGYLLARAILKLSFRSNSDCEYFRLVEHFHSVLFKEGLWLRVISPKQSDFDTAGFKHQLMNIRANWVSLCKSLGLAPFPQYGYDRWLYREFLPVAFGPALADALEKEFGSATVDTN